MQAKYLGAMLNILFALPFQIQIVQQFQTESNNRQNISAISRHGILYFSSHTCQTTQETFRNVSDQ